MKSIRLENQNWAKYRLVRDAQLMELIAEELLNRLEIYEENL